MRRYGARRTLLAIPQLLLISAILFAVIHLPPGGPADLYLSDPSATPADVERLKGLWGLDRPVWERYARWLGNIVRGDWSYSYHERRPVTAVIWERLPNTLLLAGAALGISLAVGVPIGVLTAVRPRAWHSRLLQVASVLGFSTPTFWTGTLVILLFSVKLRWLPAGGVATIGAPFSIADRLWHLLGPAAVLATVYTAQWARYLHAQVGEVLAEDYVRVARAKGLAHRRTTWRHAVPNALLPLITLIGVEGPRLVSGAMVTEVVFSWPGLGRLITQALLGRDYPVVMGALMLLAVVVVAGNLLTDVVYGWVDPRIRYQ